MAHKYLKKVHDLISKNRFDQTIELLESLLDGAAKAQLLLLKTRYKDLEQHYLRGVIETDKYIAQKSHITNGLIHFTSEIKIPKYLTNKPSNPTTFIGRDSHLEQVRTTLTNEVNNDNLLFLINGNGGIGKTTLAARYFHQYADDYKHLAWVFAENGIFNALLTLEEELGVNAPPDATEKERFNALLKATEELNTPCLLVIDNANNPEDLEQTFESLKELKSFHILLTSRINEFDEATIHKLPPLGIEEAKKLFKKHYPNHNTDEDKLLEDILNAVDRNTLVIELLAKNLRQKNRLKIRYALEDLYNDLVEKGLFYVQANKKVKTSWSKNVKLKAEDAIDVIKALYDLEDLSKAEQQVLANLSVLPAAFLHFELLEQVITEHEDLDDIIITLYQKGWLEFNEAEKKIRINQVVQETCRFKNKNLFEDCTTLIRNLINKLDYEGDIRHFINSGYNEAQIYAEWSESLLIVLDRADYFLNGLRERTGSFYIGTGNFQKGLNYYEQYSKNEKKCFELSPQKKELKNNLAISYGNLGDIYTKSGNFQKALSFFELCFEIVKELHEEYPNNTIFKHTLSITYSRLGSTYVELKKLNKALKLYKKYSELTKELFAKEPNNLAYKYGLAISYSKLGKVHKNLSKLNLALSFFEESLKLKKDLYNTNPDNVKFKNGLATSYSNLGEAQLALGNDTKALNFFKNEITLNEELYQAYSNNINFKNNLAISYSQLGRFYRDQKKDKVTARKHFLQCEQLWKELAESYPAYAEFQNNFEWVKDALENLEE